ncbi:MAG: single-stranded DNA-binding protein [Bacteroidia bacterium]
MSVNKVMLIGRLGKDPEVRYINDNVAVANFSIATGETYKDSNGNRIEKTEWHNIVVWRGLADVAGKYLKKGSQIYLEGKLQTRSYDDQSGNKRYITEVVANDFRMLDTRGGQNGGNDQGQGGQQNQQGGYQQNNMQGGVSESNATSQSVEDDLPF